MRSHSKVLFQHEFGGWGGHYSSHHNFHAPFQGESGGFENSGVGKGKGECPTHTSLVGLVEGEATCTEVPPREGQRDFN